MIIKSSADKNISIPANKENLEKNLASYYKDQKPLPASTIVTATVSVILLERCCKVCVIEYSFGCFVEDTASKMSCVIVLVSLNLGFIFPCFYSLSYIVSKTNTKEEAKNELKVKLSLF